MRFRTLIATAGFALSLTAAAGAPGPDAGRQLVDAFISDVTTLSSEFEQRLIDANGDVIEFSTGALDINRPGQFRWAYFEPYEQLLVADGANIWSYDVDLAQVTVKPQLDALANTPALLLSGAANAMDEFEYAGSYEADGLTWVRLTPRDTESDFKRVELAFGDGVIARMVFFDNLEQRTAVHLYDVVLNDPIEASKFSFAIPDGVDVVGTPTSADAATR